MQIHELDDFIGTIDDSTHLAIDDGTETYKIPAGNFIGVLVVETASISSLPVTITDPNITTDMVCIKAELGTPSAQTGDWTVNTDTVGQAVVEGSMSGSTTLKLYLAKSR